jgi:hypothetical protein
MGDRSYCPDYDSLTTALHELDKAKALLYKEQMALNRAFPALSHVDSSPSGSYIFEAKARELNEATKRYLRAIGSFNAACQRRRTDSRQEFLLTSESHVRSTMPLRFERKGVGLRRVWSRRS